MGLIRACEHHSLIVSDRALKLGGALEAVGKIADGTA